MTRILHDTRTGTLLPEWSEALLEGEPDRYRICELIELDPPFFDPLTQRLEEELRISNLSPRVVRGWSVVSLHPQVEEQEQEPQWVEFSAALASDPLVNQFVATLASLTPVLHLMIGVGLGQAAQGDPRTLLKAWQKASSAGLVSPELLAHVRQLSAEHFIPASFVDALAPAEEA